MLPGGIFYSKDLFAKAGITETPPKTLDDLEADITKLKAAGIAPPIALGGEGRLAGRALVLLLRGARLRQGPHHQPRHEEGLQGRLLADRGGQPAEVRAGRALQRRLPHHVAQQGANSSAGLVANHKAAMELMGAWDPGVIASLTPPDQKPLADLDWFPFPEVSGGKGEAGAMMGGLDGYSCSEKSPSSCEKFLNFVSSKEWQEKYAVAFQTIPANQDAKGAVDNASLKP